MLKKKFHPEHWQVMAAYLMIYDLIVIAAAYFFALWIRFDCRFQAIPKEYLDIYFKTIIPYTLYCVFVFWGLRLYKSIWRFASYNELIRMTLATVITSLSQILAVTALVGRMPISYYFFGVIIQFVMTLGIRFAYRFVLLLIGKVREPEAPLKHVLLVGAGAAGQMILRDIKHAGTVKEKVCCFIDDNPNKWGRYIDGIPVEGGRDEIMRVCAKYHIQKIYVVIPSASSEAKKDILNICNQTGCELLNLPGMYQLYTGDVTVSNMKEVAVEDLLGRDPIKVNMDEIFQHLKGKAIMVTGGGGSIGSELCRQIAAHEPKQLIIFDIYENNAYDIQLELKKKYPELDLVVRIGSVRDSRLMFKIFETYRPEIVYHAAAHKHVPLMEVSPAEAVKNNVFGTKNLLTSAAEHGVERFVQLSTDKAVNPTNVMGCTKRICEMLIQTFAKNTSMKCMAVRFGNVLGSHGSVIPLFEEQIKNGGPVTITHPDIVRYFMTIPEAAQLVLQAGGLAQSGSIYVLDMGEPVKIMDLATRLIRFYGYEPNVNMEIKVTGLRPGEKLYEELMLDSEQDRMTKTAHDKIFIAPPMQIDLAAFYEELQNLRHDAEHNDEGVVLSLQRMVGTYHPNRVVNEDHTVSAAHGNTETIDKEELQKALDEQHSTQQNAQ